MFRYPHLGVTPPTPGLATTPPQASLETREPHARDYLRPIVGRKWLLLCIVVMITAGTYGYYVRQPAVYEAATKIFVGHASDSPTATGLPTSDRTIQNQATLLQSREVAQAVANKLGRPGEATLLAGSITAIPSSGSDFVVITARRPEAKDAARVANEFASAFVQIRSRQQRAEITKALEETRSQLDRLPAKQSNEAARATLSESVRRLQLSLAVPSGSATQIDPALAPAAAIAPRPARNTLFAFALSLIAAIALAFGLERFDRRVRRVEDIAPLYKMPILAALPHTDQVSFRADGAAALGPAFKEAFRQLRTNIQLEALDRPLRRVLVTSAISGEGKSTVVRNLAIALRESGLRVAVVDADMRRPALARLFGVECGHGLTDVLIGNERLNDALVTVSVHARSLGTLAKIEASVGASNGAPSRPEVISLLAAGTHTANPQAVLAADQTRLLLDEVGAQHDIVLIDSPPLLVVSDAVELAAHADAVIIVARLGLTTRDSARSVSDLLARIPGAHPIGVVLNDLTYFEGYGYGYGYGYGDSA